MKQILGFDYWNTISDAPDMFAAIASGCISEGGKVYVISAIGPKRSKEETIEAIKQTGVPYTDIYVVVWNKSPREAPELKLQICQQLGVECFFDDRADTCEHLAKNGIHAMHYMQFKGNRAGLREVQPKSP